MSESEERILRAIAAMLAQHSTMSDRTVWVEQEGVGPVMTNETKEEYAERLFGIGKAAIS